MKPFKSGCVAVVVALGAFASSALGAEVRYIAYLDGLTEEPPVVTPGTGIARVTIDTLTNMMRVQADFSGLTGVTTVAHIHAPTAVAFTGTVGVATQPGTFTGWPAGVTSGSYDMTFDMTNAANYTAGFTTLSGGTVDSARALLFASFADGKAYFNIHTDFRPGGEIRGFFRPVVPLPSAGLLGLAGLGAVASVRRRA